MVRDSEGFAYPRINPEICVKCGKCDKTCPALNLQEKFPNKLPKVFVAVNLDEKIRLRSSSGGVFSALGEMILNEGGVVFGAGFDKSWRVIHTSAENLTELENLRGSKYVQSKIGDTYSKIKKHLETGRKVLFSGTACQCSGLKHFLGKDFDNLLTVDIICHGVPSPMIWENYIDWHRQGHEISSVNFRNKRDGWNDYKFEINFKDCENFSNKSTDNLYMKNFLMSTIQRPSCHDCKFRFPNTASDITLGDGIGH